MLAEFATNLQPQMHAATVGALSPILPKIEARLDALDTKTGVLEAKMDGKVATIEASVNTLSKQVAEVREALALRETDPFVRIKREAVDPEAFDATLVRVSAKSNVGIEGIKSLVAELVASAAIPPTACQVFGPAVGKSFRVCFGGEVTNAARQATKLLASLRGSDGAWRETSVRRPGNQGSERVYLGADQSANARRCATRVKLLAAVLNDKYPSLDVHADKRAGVISSSWQTLATLRKGADFGEADWEADIAASHGVDANAIQCEFAARIAAIPQRG